MDAPADKLPDAGPRTTSGAQDPYAAPRADLALQHGPGADDEKLRRELLNTEASIKSVGSLYYLSAFGFIVMAFGLAQADLPEMNWVVMAVLFGGFGVAFAFVGRGLRRLAPGARLPATVLSVIGLLGFPIGTLFNGYILYLLHCAKGKRVMTPEHAELIARTPHIKYRSSRVVVVAVVLLIVLFAAVLIPGLMRTG